MEAFLRTRGVTPPVDYPYKRYDYFTHTDYGFDELIDQSDTAGRETERGIWARVMTRLLKGSSSEWSTCLHASITQTGRTFTYNVHCGPIPAQWVQQLRTRLVFRTPSASTAYRRSYYFARLRPSLSLVLSPLSRPILTAKKPGRYCSSSGYATRPRGRANPRPHPSACRSPRAMRELGKWYDALDRVLGRRRPGDLETIQEALRSQRLIFTHQEDWVFLGEVFQS